MPVGSLRTSKIVAVTAVAVVVALVTTIGLSLLSPTPAGAADNGQWSIFPTTAPKQLVHRPYFAPLMTPGVAVHDSITVTNETKASLTFQLYAADAFNTNDGGLFALHTLDQPNHDMGRWIHLPVRRLTVAPRSQAIVAFTIDPPANASPGDHPGGIVAVSTQAAVTNRGSLHTRALEGVAVRVYGRVRGPIHPGLAVTNFHITAHGGLAGLVGGGVDTDVSYTIVNTGNVILQSSLAQLSLEPLIGSAAHRSYKIGQLLPGGAVTRHERISGVVPVLYLRGEVTARSAAVVAHGSTWTLVVPWLLLAVIAVLALARWYRRRRRRRAVEPTSYVPRHAPADAVPSA